MRQRFFTALVTIITLILLNSCTSKPKYVIGISQCNDNVWRDKQNKEIAASKYLYDDVELIFTCADGKWEKQVQQIDSMIDAGVNLLMVSPSVSSHITTSIDRAMSKGIPVIIFDRKIDSNNYTAFIGGDNFEIGMSIGDYIKRHAQGNVNIVEIKALQGSSIARDRHQGFMKAISSEPNLHVIATGNSDGTAEQGYAVMDSLIKNELKDSIDFIFAHTDRIGLGAYKALHDNGLYNDVKICGIDGLPDDDGGISQVLTGREVGSAIYPTGGDKILDLAMNILQGKQFHKNNKLESLFVTKNNANAVMLQYRKMQDLQNQLERVNERLNSDLKHMATQRLLYGITACVFILIIALFFVYIRYLKMTNSRNDMREIIMNDIATNKFMVNKETRNLLDKPEMIGIEIQDNHNKFANLLLTDIQEHISDQEFNVDHLASDLNMSRAQLYRKVKALTGQTPVELVRSIRLNKANDMLANTSHSIGEIAYAVGFSSPAYFTKCYKEKYGHTPREKEEAM